MAIKEQTLTAAVKSSVFWGAIGKVLGILKHSIIAGAIGLSAQLDAFYAATSILAVMVFLVAGVFDILAVPRLIELQKQSNTKEFVNLSRSLFTTSILFGCVSFLAMYFFAAEFTVLARGFEDQRRLILQEGIVIISTIALFYFPYRQIAAIHRAQSSFAIYYQSDFLVTLTWFMVVFFYRETPMILFYAWPIGVAVGFLYISINTPNLKNYLGSPFSTEATKLWKRAPAIALLQGIVGLHVAVDHFYASYLDVGAIGALSLAMVIITGLVGVLRLDTSFITIFSKSDVEERTRYANKLISFGVFVSIPFMATVAILGDQLVKLLYEYGVFKSTHGSLIASLLLAYSPTALVLVLLAPIEEMYQVAGKLSYILKRALLGLLINAVLCYFFVFVIEAGSKGIALSTSISMLFTLAYAISGLKKLAITVNYPTLIKNAVTLSLPIFILAWSTSQMLIAYNSFLITAFGLIFYAVATLAVVSLLPLPESVIIKSRFRRLYI